MATVLVKTGFDWLKYQPCYIQHYFAISHQILYGYSKLITVQFCLSYDSVPFLLDDIKNVQSTLHRNQSPSPSRGSSRASSSPVSSTSYISDACTSLSKAEDATTATSTSMSSSPVNAGPSSYRAQWVLSRKLSGRSRFSELQGKFLHALLYYQKYINFYVLHNFNFYHLIEWNV